MMTLIYSEPSRGKSLATIAAFPNAQFATPKPESIIEPGRLYGLDLTSQVTQVSSSKELLAWAGKHKGVPRVADDISDIMEKEFAVIERSKNYDNDYAELNRRWLPLLRAIADRTALPFICTAWAKPPATIKDLAGDKQLQPGGWAAPGAKMRATVPGLCTHYLRVRAEAKPKSAWPFEFQTCPDKLWEARCRRPASVPKSMPLALSAIYRAAGYECESMFSDQASVREAAHEILTGDERTKMKDQLTTVFEQAIAAGANPHAIAYAITEAKAQIAMEEHTAALNSTLVGSFV